MAWALDHTEPQIPQGMVIGQDAIKSSKGEGEDLWRNIVLKESFFLNIYILTTVDTYIITTLAFLSFAKGEFYEGL